MDPVTPPGGSLQLHGGAVWTGDPERPWADGIRIVDGRVASLEHGRGGPAASARLRLDLGGRVALPGIVDAHVHLLPWARRLGETSLIEARSLEEIQGILRRALAALDQADAWLFASGFHLESLGGARPHRAMLDAVSAGRPIYVRTHDTHGAWVNSAALAAAGIGPATPDPARGIVERDASGHPTGFFLELAQELLRGALPAAGGAEDLAAMARGQREALRLGVTAVQSFEGADEWTVLQKLRERGNLDLRVTHMFPHRELEHYALAGLRTGFGDAWLRLGCVKLFADGTLGLRTARMLEPYASGGTGAWTTPPEELRAAAGRAAAAGIGVAIHAIGDAATRACLDALGAARAIDRDVPLRIEHAQIVHPDDIPRFRASRITASMQPIHFRTDRALAAREWGARCAHAYAWGPFRASGAELVFGTDAPIEPLSPWANLAAALGEGGASEPAHSALRALPLHAALEAMTRAPRRAMGEPGGLLRPGWPGDLVVIDRTAAQLEAGEDVRGIEALLTVVHGRPAHAAGPFRGLAS